MFFLSELWLIMLFGSFVAFEYKWVDKCWGVRFFEDVIFSKFLIFFPIMDSVASLWRGLTSEFEI